MFQTTNQFLFSKQYTLHLRISSGTTRIHKADTFYHHSSHHHLEYVIVGWWNVVSCCWLGELYSQYIIYICHNVIWTHNLIYIYIQFSFLFFAISPSSVVFYRETARVPAVIPWSLRSAWYTRLPEVDLVYLPSIPSVQLSLPSRGFTKSLEFDGVLAG